MEDGSVWMRGNRQRQGGAEAAPLVVDKKPEGWMGGGGQEVHMDFLQRCSLLFTNWNREDDKFV
jgi:hypothetical protein